MKHSYEILNRVVFSYDSSDYFEALETTNRQLEWKSIVMDKDVAVSVGGSSLSLKALEHPTDEIMITLSTPDQD